MTNFIEQYFIDTKVCDSLISYHKKNKEYKNPGYATSYDGECKIDKNTKDSIDVVVFNNSRNKTIMKYFKELDKCLVNYHSKYNLLCNLHSDISNNIQYYPPGGGFKKWHAERSIYSPGMNLRYLVYMTYLNDVKEGGETEFLYQKIAVKPKKGLTLIWPADFTHTHRGVVAPKEEKYIITGWFNLVP